MRLMRLGEPGHERPVARVDERRYVELGDVVSDIDEAFFAAGGAAAVRDVVDERIATGATHEFGTERIAAPIARPHQILCIGLNYRKHAEEVGAPIPAEPILFTKSPNTLVGPHDDVRIPRGSAKTDWEVELGIVVGERSSYLADEAAAERAIAGYVLCNDVSEREFQLERGGQWAKGKSAETFNPCGPWLATRDEIDDVLSLGLWLDVNDQRRQTGETADLIFTPAQIVHYLSQFMVLEPGDLINTGTPHGVAMSMDPPPWLQPGDVITLGIDELGTQRQTVVGPRDDGPSEARHA